MLFAAFAIFKSGTANHESFHAGLGSLSPQIQTLPDVHVEQFVPIRLLRTHAGGSQMDNHIAFGKLRRPVVVEIAIQPNRFLRQWHPRFAARATHGKNVVPRGQRLFEKMAADESRSAGDENIQRSNLGGKKLINPVCGKFHHLRCQSRINADEQRLVHDGVRAL